MGEDGAKTVVVTGDVMMEFRLAQSKRRDRTDASALFDPYNYMEVYRKPVGAFSVGNILRKVFAGLPAVCSQTPTITAPDRAKIEALVGDDDESPFWHSYSLCAQYPRRKSSSARADEDDPVWRISQKLGVDRAARSAMLPKLVESGVDDPAEAARRAALIVVEQSQHGFMEQGDTWPRSLSEPRDDAWLLVEWSRPNFKRDTVFWETMCSKFGGRIVVVVTAEDLRYAGMQISRSLSWERTVADLYAEIERVWDDGPGRAISRLNGCAHLVVSFETSGAVLFSKGDRDLSAILVYDPAHLEKGWSDGYDGSMSGFTRCLTAGVAMEMIYKDFGAFGGEGIKAGIVAARHLLENGFEAVGARKRDDTQLPRDLRYPADSIAAVLRSVLVATAPAPIDQAEAAAHRLSDILKAAAKRMESILTDEVLNAPPFALAEQPGDTSRSLPAESTTIEALLDRGALSLSTIMEAFHTAWPLAIGLEAVDREVQTEFDAWKQVALDDLRTAEDAAHRIKRLSESNSGLIERMRRFLAPDRAAMAAAASLHIAPIDLRRDLSTWRLLEDTLPPGDEASSEAANITEHCITHVQFGSPRTSPYPTAHFGNLFVVDRQELENLSAIQELITNYMNSTDAKPLSIAVFGVPGSGKSFTITEVASQLSDRRRVVKALTFNLSQLAGPEGITSALHQVRDIGLSGNLPLVFWDEFDSQRDSTLGWLRYFLAPMQDGEFQDGQRLHNVGRAIFVFAGGTHVSMDDFLRRARTSASRPGQFSEDAVRAKVPDFISRLKGFVDIPTLDYTDNYKGGSNIVAATALRRAELLRTFLRKSAPKLGESVLDTLQPVLRERLNVDDGVIAAFMRIKRFRYAARSMESIVKMSALSGKSLYDQSSLPPLEQLELHVDAKAFLQLAKRKWSG